MALPSFCTETVTVTRAPYIEQRGVKVRDWDNAQSHYVTGCSVQYASTTTDREEPRDARQSDATLYAPPGADIQPEDRITCAFGIFAVDGRPMPRVSPTGAVSHVEVGLSMWEG